MVFFCFGFFVLCLFSAELAFWLAGILLCSCERSVCWSSVWLACWAIANRIELLLLLLYVKVLCL
jgi:hypothetical protein